MIVALDVDDVLAAFTPHAHHFYAKELKKCNYWSQRVMDSKFGKDWFEKDLAFNKKFWKTLPRLSDPKDINFDFEYYISAFPEQMYKFRVEWLKKQGFPEKPLILTFDKLNKCLELEVDVLIDDKPETIKNLQGSSVRGIHFIPPYAGFKPVGEYVRNLNQIKI